MLKRRQLFQIAGVAAVAGVGGAAWMYSGSRRSDGLAGGPFRHYPFDPVAAENFQQKLFIPVASGPFGVLDVVGPLKIRATAASFPLLPGPKAQAPSPFLLYQTEHAGQAYQNPILRIESGARFTLSLDNALAEPTIIHWHGLHTPAAMDGHPGSTIAPGGRFDYDFTVSNRGGTYWYHTHAHELTAEQAYNGWRASSWWKTTISAGSPKHSTCGSAKPTCPWSYKTSDSMRKASCCTGRTPTT